MSNMSASQEAKDKIVLAQLKGGHDEVVAIDEYADKFLTTEEELTLPEAEKKKRCHAPVGPLISPHRFHYHRRSHRHKEIISLHNITTKGR